MSIKKDKVYTFSLPDFRIVKSGDQIKKKLQFILDTIEDTGKVPDFIDSVASSEIDINYLAAVIRNIDPSSKYELSVDQLRSMGF